MRRPPLTAEAARANREHLTRLGGELRASRIRRHWSQADLGQRANLSQSVISAAERGFGATLSVDAWQWLFLATGRRLILDVSRDPTEEPADAAHLAMQELVLRIVAGRGVRASTELPTRPIDPRRSADVAFVDDRVRRITLVECWNAFGDIGASMRSTNRKLADAEALAAARWGEARRGARAVWVVRATVRNRALVARYPELFATRFPGSSVQWVRALSTGAESPPEMGLVWSDVAATRIFAWRRRGVGVASGKVRPDDRRPAP